MPTVPLPFLSTTAQADDGSKVILANSVWTHRGTQLRKAYVDAMQSVYQVGCGLVVWWEARTCGCVPGSTFRVDPCGSWTAMIH